MFYCASRETEMKRGLATPIRILLVIALLFCGLFIPHISSAKDAAVPWLKDSEPEFAVRDELVNEAKVLSMFSRHANLTCQELAFTKRDGVLLPPFLYRESEYTGCFVNSPMGAVDSQGYINISGTDYVAEMVNAFGQPKGIQAYPGNDIFISSISGSAPVGVYAWFDHLQSSMKIVNNFDGKIQAQIDPKHQIMLKDKNGNPLAIMADNVSVSDNGEWMVVDSPGKAMLRINLTTLESLPFAQSFEYGNGTGAGLRTAISSDGRYAAVASANYTYFRIFDLSTCSSIPSTISAPVTCQSRDLNEFARKKITDMGGVIQMSFLTNDLLQLYISRNTNNTTVYSKYVIAAPNTPLTGMDYLALGDSFSSGEGAHKYEIGTDEKDINMCHLSRVSYPYLLANRLDYNSFHSVACSGARTPNVKGGSGPNEKESSRNRDNQYSKIPINNTLGDWLPGYTKQTKFISTNNPHIITVSVGGNDIGFAEKLTACVKPGTCYPSYEDRQEIFNEIDGKLKTFTTTYKSLKDSATKNTRIYVVGYPQIALPTGNCALNVHFNQDELVFAASIITRLNIVIKTAAVQAGVNYVNIEDALYGHRLCENNAGNIAMNGLTAGKDRFNILGNESYHPNEFGQELIANKIMVMSNNLGNNNPDETSASLEKIKDTDPALKNAPKTNRTIKKKAALEPTKKSVTKSQKITASLKGTAYALKPNTTYLVTVGGTPAGTVTTDDNGDGEVSVDIPPDTGTGPQPVDVEGDDTTNTPIIIGGVVTVGNDGDDFDGDGIKDNTDSCPAITNSLVDSDQDGIDDACDGVIGSAPVTPVTPETSTPDANNPTAPSSTTVSEPSPAAQVLTATVSTGPANLTQSISRDGVNSVTAPQTKPETNVLGSAIAELQPVETLRFVADTAKDSLTDTASVHPLRFLLFLLSILFILLFLGIKQLRALRHSRMYMTPSRHYIHI